MASEESGGRVTTVLFDDDLFDAEVIVGRAGCARFAKEELAALLGMAVQSIWRLVALGTIPEPAIREDLPGKGRVRAYWTCAQATEILAERRRPKVVPECGTHAAWSRHRRLGEPLDDACREAHNAANRASQARSRARFAGVVPLVDA